MSTFKQESDTLDIDRYLNLDHSVSPSPSMRHSSTVAMSTASAVAKGKAVATPDYFTPVQQRPIAPPPSQPQAFAGPSHQYDLHKQQTSLPLGAIADSMAASRIPYGTGLSAVSSRAALVGPPAMTSIDDLFDFNASMDRHSSLSGSSNMDLDYDPNDGDDLFSVDAVGSSGFVDPHALEGQEDESPTPARAEVVRIWPGMHTQQAALAKQQQQQQQQQQLAAQQQKAKEAQKAQQPVPVRSNAPASHRKSDPIVEERISRLLNQMRHSSIPSSNEDSNPSQTHVSHPRLRKDEADMDEDERLLASEEGKKLSSKERRQLRNKVSARAFRSRRKEYISQLEGELSGKGAEADELRAENDALKAENTRLTDLTRMLLSSPAFSTFLNDLSSNPSNLPSTATQTQPQQQQQQQQQQQPTATSTRDSQEPPKDLPAHQPTIQAQNPAHVGMALLPETTMDFSSSVEGFAEPINMGSWGVGMDFGFNAQVFAVTDLPECPAVDTSVLSGKLSSSENQFSTLSSCKNEAPAIEEMPASVVKKAAPETEEEDVELDPENPAFALFVDSPAPSAKIANVEESEYRIFGPIEPEKAFARLDLVLESEKSEENVEEEGSTDEIDAATMARFVTLCSSIDEAADRLANFIVRM